MRRRPVRLALALALAVGTALGAIAGQRDPHRDARSRADTARLQAVAGTGQSEATVASRVDWRSLLPAGVIRRAR